MNRAPHPPTRPTLKLALGSLAIFGFCSCGEAPVQPPASPNIVLILADDLGFGDVGYNGSEIRTPAIDRLAAEGVKLDRFYAYPLCSPTRAALMTGRSALSTGVLRPFEPWLEAGLPLDEKLMPEYFREVGYQTFAVGKWHLGPNKKVYHPQRRGFDHFYGHLGGFLNHYSHSVWRRLDWQRNGSTVLEQGYSTHLITAEAIGLIRNRDRDKPVFLYVSYSAPHTPLQAPPEAIAEYGSIENETRRIYAAMVTEMDRGIADLRAALEEEGLLEQTLVMFMSDNGGRPRLGANNGPLRGEKSSAHEGGIRVPALLRWPAELRQGATFDQRFVVQDALPTLLSAAGIPAKPRKPLDGRDVWPALARDAPFMPGPAVLARGGGPNFDFLYAYFSDEWKLVRGRDNDTGQLTLQLFRIREDPYEQNDLAAEHPDVLTRLASAFEAIPKAEMIGAGAAPEPDYGDNRGGSSSVLPDETPPSGIPYAEAEWRNRP